MVIQVTQFRHMRGVVYILENAEAQRVKVGMTTGDVTLRLRDANDMWFGHKLTCQICGGRRLAKMTVFGPRLMPKHVISGISCPGGNALPLESDIALAHAHLESLRRRLDDAMEDQKGAMRRKIAALENRIKCRCEFGSAVGTWKVGTVYSTDCAEQVELLSHEFIAEYLDSAAPFGEVFKCSILMAQEAVERALKHLGLFSQARREDLLHNREAQ